MQTPEQKMNLAATFKQLGVYDAQPELFYDAITSTMGPIVGLEDDPSRARMKRQLSAWSMGPPEGWVEKVQAELEARQVQLQELQAQLEALPSAPPAQTSAEPPLDPAAPPAPPDPAQELQAQLEQLAQAPPPDPEGALAAVFERVEADELPTVAPIRLAELTRFMASTRYTRWPPAWRAGVAAEFQQMKLCAGIFTVPEQMQQAEQQAQQEQEAAAQAEALKHQNALQLEEVKQEGRLEAAGPPGANGNGKGGAMELNIDRDPTGRPARYRWGGPPPAQLEGAPVSG